MNDQAVGLILSGGGVRAGYQVYRADAAGVLRILWRSVSLLDCRPLVELLRRTRVLSYLLFERGYCRHLMRLGFSEAMVLRPRILEFLGHDSVLDRSRHQKRAAA